MALIPLFFLRGNDGAPSLHYFSSLSILGSLGRRPKMIAGKFRFAFLAVPLFLFTIALARPQWTKEFKQHQQSGVDIVIAIDVSGSMDAIKDVMINQRVATRLFVAKELSKEFIANRPHDRIGVVAFAGRPYQVSPITSSHEWLSPLIDSEVIFSREVTPGTAVGSAIAFSSTLLTSKAKNSKSKIVILITDGSSNQGKSSPQQAAKLAAQAKVKVYTLAIGTEDGRIEDRQFKVPIQEFDTKTLEEVAEITDGKFYRSGSTESLREAFEAIDQLEKVEAPVNRYQNVREYHHWFSSAGALLLVFWLMHQLRKVKGDF